MGDESQLCDNELMVVLALIKAICRVEFPHYPPFTPSYASETGLVRTTAGPRTVQILHHVTNSRRINKNKLWAF